MKFHIVSDSSCDLGLERTRELGITMVSFYAQLGDDVYYREELDIFDFFAGMSGGGMPSGGRPSGGWG